MKNQFISVVRSMVNSLESEFNKKEIMLSNLNFNSESEMLNSLDELLKDGGEFRCERFTDLTHEFAFNFGCIESEEFEDVKWKCIELAYNVLKKKYEKEYLEDSFSTEEILVVVEDGCILEGKVKVDLSDIIDGDLDDFLDLLDEKLTDALMLQEINYEMIKCIPEESAIIFNVSGDISDRLEELEEECFEFIDEYIEKDEEENEYEIALNYKGIEVYHVYPDNDPRENSPYEYHFSLNPGNSDEEFDVRDFNSYDENLSVIDNLKIAIDEDLI